MNQVSSGAEHCAEVRILLDAYLDSELGLDTARWVVKHLSTCPDCEAVRAERTQAKAALKAGVQGLEPDPAFEHLLRRRLRDQAKPRPFKGLAQLAIAAAALIVVFAGWTWLRESAPAPGAIARAEQETHIEALYRLVSATTRVGLGDHIHCAHYRDFGSTLPSFEEMVEKLGPDYQDLLLIAKRAAPTGFQVALGHRCKFRDRPFVHVVLRRDDELLSVVLAERRPEESFELDGLMPAFQSAGLGVYQQSAEQFQIASFETSRHLAYVISNVDGAANLQIAASLTPDLAAFLSALEG